MSPEEYKRLKEAEKAHLRKLKELKKTAHLLGRRKAVNDALESLATGSKEALDVHDEMVDKLTMETIQQEARLEIALENQAMRDAEATPDASARTLEASEEVLRKERAKSLVEQMKLQMGTAPETTTPPAPQPKSSETQDEDASSAPPEVPEKTIGRMR